MCLFGVCFFNLRNYPGGSKIQEFWIREAQINAIFYTP